MSDDPKAPAGADLCGTEIQGVDLARIRQGLSLVDRCRALAAQLDPEDRQREGRAPPSPADLFTAIGALLDDALAHVGGGVSPAPPMGTAPKHLH